MPQGAVAVAIDGGVAQSSKRAQTRDAEAWAFCHDILVGVSRTFAMSIPMLPKDLADSICCAYLVCRIADTIEDERGLDPALQTQLFDLLGEWLDHPGHRSTEEQFLSAWPGCNNHAYERLMQGCGHVLRALGTLTPEYQESIRTCAHEMIGGMRIMTRTRPDEHGVTYIATDLPGLERYCHYVAGTVGQMLTRLFAGHAGADFASEQRIEEGRIFGLGLQLTNILKDLSEDHASGVSFVPAEWLQDCGASHGTALKPKYKRMLVEQTLAHLQVAHRYTMALPAEPSGLRLFCLWAAWMSLGTLREICTTEGGSPKISRIEVAEIVSDTRNWVTNDTALQKGYDNYHARTAEAVAKLT